MEKKTLIDRLKTIVGPEYVLHSEMDLTLYGYDASLEKGKPDVVVLPGSTEEVAGVVESFLEDTYGPAKRLAEVFAAKNETMLLFIGKKDCNVCRRCEPILEDFLKNHKDLELANLDYSQPEGLLYHMIHDQDRGMLPLIAFIFRGKIMMVFTGECHCSKVYEKCYSDILAKCSQNIYAH